MVSPDTISRAGRSNWTLMIAIHDALRRDLNELLHTTAGRAVARTRWNVFRDHLRFHLAAEDAVIWWPAAPGWPATRTARSCWMRWKTSTD